MPGSANRRIFKCVRQGWYVLNPLLSLRRGQKGKDDTWTPLPQALNLALARELAQPAFWEDMDEFYVATGFPALPTPILRAPFEAAEARRQQELATRTGWRK